MDVQTIASRTGLPLRKLRYVLDHRLLPGMKVKLATERIGHPRSFSDLEGFGIACAAALVQAGARRETVTSFMAELCSLVWPESKRTAKSKTMIEKAFEPGSTPALAIVGDGLNLRFQFKTTDTGWIQPGTGAQLKDYRPRVWMQLDLQQLRDDLQA